MVPDQVVGEDHRERLVTDHGLRAEHRVPETQRFGLGHEYGANPPGQYVADQLQLFVLAGALQLLLQLVGLVEVIGDGVLVAIGDENQGVAARFDGLVHRVLDQRPVDDRQHFLGDGFGCREKTGTEAGHGEHGLAYTSGHHTFLAVRRGSVTTVAEPGRGACAWLPMGWNSGTSSRNTRPSVSRS